MKVAVLGQLLDRIAAIEKDAFIAIDIGDLRLAGRCRGEARIVGEDPALAVELGDLEDVRTQRSVPYREVQRLAFDRQFRRGCFVGHVCLLALRVHPVAKFDDQVNADVHCSYRPIIPLCDRRVNITDLFYAE